MAARLALVGLCGLALLCTAYAAVPSAMETPAPTTGVQYNPATAPVLTHSAVDPAPRISAQTQVPSTATATPTQQQTAQGAAGEFRFAALPHTGSFESRFADVLPASPQTRVVKDFSDLDLEEQRQTRDIINAKIDAKRRLMKKMRFRQEFDLSDALADERRTLARAQQITQATNTLLSQAQGSLAEIEGKINSIRCQASDLIRAALSARDEVTKQKVLRRASNCGIQLPGSNAAPEGNRSPVTFRSLIVR